MSFDTCLKMLNLNCKHNIDSTHMLKTTNTSVAYRFMNVQNVHKYIIISLRHTYPDAVRRWCSVEKRCENSFRRHIPGLGASAISVVVFLESRRGGPEARETPLSV